MSTEILTRPDMADSAADALPPVDDIAVEEVTDSTEPNTTGGKEYEPSIPGEYIGSAVFRMAEVRRPGRNPYPRLTGRMALQREVVHIRRVMPKTSW